MFTVQKKCASFYNLDENVVLEELNPLIADSIGYSALSSAPYKVLHETACSLELPLFFLTLIWLAGGPSDFLYLEQI